MSDDEQNDPVPFKVRRIQNYECTATDYRIRRELKAARGSICEKCGRTFPLGQLAAHHILEARIFPEHAREPLNMVILCSRCHGCITEAERFGASAILHFYATLKLQVRERHLPFLEKEPETQKPLVDVFRSGDATYWNARHVEDLTR